MVHIRKKNIKSPIEHLHGLSMTMAVVASVVKLPALAMFDDILAGSCSMMATGAPKIMLSLCFRYL